MKLLFLIVCLPFMIVCFSACQLFDKPGKPGSNKILDNPPYRSLTDSISRFPDDAAIYLKRAELLSQKDYHELAHKDYKKAWQLNPDEGTALAYASNLFISGREDEAIGLLQECLTKFPGNAEFSRRLSEAYLQSGKSKEALAQYNSIVAADTGNFEAWYEKGLLLAQLKDTLQAVASLEKAYALQPLQVFGLTLANFYAETRNPKVIGLCDDMLSRDSAQELTDAVFIKGIYFANINKPLLALEQFEGCIRRDWKFTDAYMEKGIILYGQKNIDEALKTFALAAKVSNTDADAYFWMGRCYESIGNKEEAGLNYSRALALDRNFSEAMEGLNRVNGE